MPRSHDRKLPVEPRRPEPRASIDRVKRTMAVILAGGEGERLSILSQERAKPAVPFGGKYRIIDFTLSNCVNSDIDDVVVLTQYNPRSLNDHIGLGPPVGPRPQPRRRQAAPAVHRAGQGRRVVPRHGRRGPAQHQRHRARPGRHRPGPRRRPHLQDGLPAVRGRPPPPPGRRHDRRPPRPARRGDRGWGSSPSTRTTASPSGRRSPSSPRATSPRWASTSSPRRRSGAGCPRTASTSGRNVIPAMLEAGARVFGYRYNGYWQDVGTIQSFWEANMRAPRRRPGARPVRQGLGHPHPLRGTRAGQGRADGAGPQEPDQPRLRHRRDGRQLGPVAGRPGRRRRGRARLDRHVRLGRSARAPSSIGRSSTRRSSSARARSSATGRTTTGRTSRSRAASTPGITVVGKRAVIPRGVRIGRNVKVAADVRSSDFAGRVVRSGESVERKRAPRASRATGTSAEPAKETVAVGGVVGGTGRRGQEGRRGELTLGRSLRTISARLRGPCHPPRWAPPACARPMSRAGSPSSA